MNASMRHSVGACQTSTHSPSKFPTSAPRRSSTTRLSDSTIDCGSGPRNHRAKLSRFRDLARGRRPYGRRFLPRSRDRAGATVLKPAKKSFWGGYGGVVQAPDGAIWKVASSSKKPTGAPTREFDDLVLLLGVDDVAATKQFYVDRGFTVGGRATAANTSSSRAARGSVKLALYGRKAAAKDAGVDAAGSGGASAVDLRRRRAIRRSRWVRLGMTLCL